MTSHRTILITGVTGNQGGAVAQALQGTGFYLRGLTRMPDSERAAALARHGVDVVKGDLDDEATLRRALAGAWGVFGVQNAGEAGVETFYDGCQVPPNFLCRLAHHLPGDVSQVVILVIRFMVSPHHENNLEPLRSQSSQRLMLAVTFSPLIAIVLLRPLRLLQRVK